MTPDQEIINYLITRANQIGLDGMLVVGWVPPQNAGNDWRGTFVIATPVPKDGASS